MELILTQFIQSYQRWYVFSAHCYKSGICAMAARSMRLSVCLSHYVCVKTCTYTGWAKNWTVSSQFVPPVYVDIE